MSRTNQPTFDKLLMSRTRLGIISALIGGDRMEFTYLRDFLKLTDGNLSVQISNLEKAGYVKVEKVFLDRKPKTFCRITGKGQKALKNLVKQLEYLVDLT